ncbi:GntR family transcriptional regulator [Siculibacillus lacustris]|uniref:GntR family transcriptional regulator n=1 Tax=Siculibacillus lacustris TaxID=1549641 RepID=A0A4V2KT16_9HYPH|nr:GntR family transcriptional regulator [Siculibacillus lacustris]TBW35336.1 GntR family transcriptional regulator [Siculibacillus lacustris]
MSPFVVSDLATSSEPIARRLVELLRHAVVTMQIRPGERLSEQDIARRFGVSRQPVREAFIKLAESGLVRILPQRGTLVVKISRTAVEDARFIREAIECAVVREAAIRRGGDLLPSLHLCLDDMERAFERGDGARFFALDDDFHAGLAAAAGRPAAWRIVVDLKSQMDRVRYLDVGEAVPMHTVLAQHRDILTAVEAGDPVAAEHAVHEHLIVILTKLPMLEARWPDLFETEDEAEPPARAAVGG